MADVLVLTPGGFRPSSVVHPLPPGNVIDGSAGRLRSLAPNGAVDQDFGVMPVRPGNEPLQPLNASVPSAIAPAFGSGWITFASWTNNTGKPVTSFKTTWTVPPAPRTQSGQTIFLFNGIQNASFIY